MLVFFENFLNTSNAFFTSVVKSIGLRPVHFRSMFPNTVTPEYIEQLIDAGQFPSLEGLAPAITYFILLSVIRFVLQNYIVKVSRRCRFLCLRYAMT